MRVSISFKFETRQVFAVAEHDLVVRRIVNNVSYRSSEQLKRDRRHQFPHLAQSPPSFPTQVSHLQLCIYTPIYVILFLTTNSFLTI